MIRLIGVLAFGLLLTAQVHAELCTLDVSIGADVPKDFVLESGYLVLKDGSYPPQKSLEIDSSVVDKRFAIAKGVKTMLRDRGFSPVATSEQSAAYKLRLSGNSNQFTETDVPRWGVIATLYHCSGDDCTPVWTPDLSDNPDLTWTITKESELFSAWEKLLGIGGFPACK